jgi:Protein of unknown function (DUF1353)
MIIGRLFTDWQRYNIQDCQFQQTETRKIGPKLWELLQPNLFAWTWDRGRQGIMHPAGYRWDGASIPQRVRDVVDSETAFEGSLPHDLLYETQGGLRLFRVWQMDGTYREQPLVDWFTGAPLSISRARADALLFAFWLAAGMHVGMAEQGYVAVYLFGQSAWNDAEPVCVTQ